MNTSGIDAGTVVVEGTNYFYTTSAPRTVNDRDTEWFRVKEDAVKAITMKNINFSVINGRIFLTVPNLHTNSYTEHHVDVATGRRLFGELWESLNKFPECPSDSDAPPAPAIVDGGKPLHGPNDRVCRVCSEWYTRGRWDDPSICPRCNREATA